MSDPRKKWFSVENEIAVHPELPHEAAPAESAPGPASAEKPSPEEVYFNSVAFEPESPLKSAARYWQSSPTEARPRPVWSHLLTAAAVGAVGGVLAVPVIFLYGVVSWIPIFMMVVFGPFSEETLKQGGMIFLLEKRPWSIRYGWQFFLAGTVGGLVFSVLENLLYQYVYLHGLPPEKLAAVMAFRWVVCTFMHVSCTWVSAFGLRRVWLEARERERPCRIADAFPWFAMAMGVHGLYNLSAMLFIERLLPS